LAPGLHCAKVFRAASNIVPRLTAQHLPLREGNVSDLGHQACWHFNWFAEGEKQLLAIPQTEQ
jgi:hypothetical protein